MSDKKKLGLAMGITCLVVMFIGVIVSISNTPKTAGVTNENDITTENKVSYGQMFRYNGLIVNVISPSKGTNEQNNKELLVSGVVIKRESGDSQTNQITFKGITKDHKVLPSFKVQSLKTKELGEVKILNEALKKPIQKGEIVKTMVVFETKNLDHLVMLDGGKPVVNIK